ncbi:MAG TPA: hypothetical protein ACFCUY_04615 [Xenococcaceae cyanobacterium]
MLRRLLVVFMSLSLCWTAIACGATTVSQPQQSFNNNVASAPTSISDGKYPIQQATYDDATGEYSLMLLNTPPGNPPVLQTANLQMARLSDAEIAEGEKTYLKVDNNQPVMYLTEDFKIEYVHNVTETQTDPQTGQPQTVVVRRESNFWSPFAGALAGQALGSLLFRPQYYVPPVYQSGGILTGYGGYGSSYSQAVDRYQTRYKTPPAAVKNRQILRTTGSIRNTSTSSKFTKPRTNNNRSTGSGVGSNTLNSSGQTRTKSSPRSSFGSSRKSFGSRSRSFGGSRGFRRR